MWCRKRKFSDIELEAVKGDEEALPPIKLIKLSSTEKSSSEQSKPKTLYDNFRKGDMVFGLHDPRDVIISKLSSQGFTYLTYVEAFNRPIIRYIMENRPQKEVKELPEYKQTAYWFFKKHDTYLRRQPGKHFGDKNVAEQKIQAALRRSCKIYLINREPSRTYRVHFSLTGIDWERVCDKKKSGISVTDSELRAAYRDYKKNGPNEFIFFYDQNDLPCAPPWEQKELAHHWKHYDEQRLAKQKQQDSKKAHRNMKLR